MKRGCANPIRPIREFYRVICTAWSKETDDSNENVCCRRGAGIAKKLSARIEQGVTNFERMVSRRLAASGSLQWFDQRLGRVFVSTSRCLGG
jgi:hypothetical protein